LRNSATGGDEFVLRLDVGGGHAHHLLRHTALETRSQSRCALVTLTLAVDLSPVHSYRKCLSGENLLAEMTGKSRSSPSQEAYIKKEDGRDEMKLSKSRNKE
jgi:hypothetical protein